MTLLLKEEDVRSLLTMPIAIEVVEQSLRRQGEGNVIVQPRRRLRMPENGLLHYMAAADPESGHFGMKLYSVIHGVARFVIPLFSSKTGEMTALIEADALGQIRTGAASGVAAKYLANPDAKTACIIGTGYQARTQLEAVAAVRKLRNVRAFGRNAERRAKFCSEMTARLNVPVEPVQSAEDAVAGADVIITATPATTVVLQGEWLTPGVHINAMGANWVQKRELDAAAVNRADIIAVDSVEQGKMEAGDLIQAFGDDAKRWESVRELGGIVAGKIPGRANTSQITLFKSVGIASWDMAAAVRVYELAVARQMGQTIPLWEAASAK